MCKVCLNYLIEYKRFLLVLNENNDFNLWDKKQPGFFGAYTLSTDASNWWDNVNSDFIGG